MSDFNEGKVLDGWDVLRLQDLRHQRDVFHASLTTIAQWDKGDRIAGLAQLARAALALFFIGPCPHGRDPFERCDTCCDVPADVVMAQRIALDAKEKAQ